MRLGPAEWFRRQDGHPSQADPHREPVPSGLPRRLRGCETHPRLGRPLSRGPQHRGHADERVSDPLPLGAAGGGAGGTVWSPAEPDDLMGGSAGGYSTLVHYGSVAVVY